MASMACCPICPVLESWRRSGRITCHSERAIGEASPLKPDEASRGMPFASNLTWLKVALWDTDRESRIPPVT